jgi:N4-gp56 family major capsid protein
MTAKAEQMKQSQVRYATAVGNGVVMFLRFALAWLWATLIGITAGLAHALNCAGGQANGFAFNDGASPASMNSGNSVTAANVIHYNAKYVANLKSRTPAQRLCSRREMPAKAGQKWQDSMWNPLPANTQEATEGSVGPGIVVTGQSNLYTLGQWADYVNFSDLLVLTDISPLVENVERELAYRCGLTIQKLTLAQMDFARTIDTSVGALDAANNTTSITRNTFVEAAGSMRGRNVQPLEGMNRFGALIHPFFVTDMMVDNSNNSYVDIMKHTIEGQMALKELPAPNGENEVISFGGVTFFETTALTSGTRSWSGGSIAIRSYVVGEDGVIAVRIERPGKTSIGDGEHKNLKLWRGNYGMGSSFDPAALIGAGTSYNIVGTWGLPPDTTMRLRAFDFVPQNT